MGTNFDNLKTKKELIQEHYNQAILESKHKKSKESSKKVLDKLNKKANAKKEDEDTKDKNKVKSKAILKKKKMDKFDTELKEALVTKSLSVVFDKIAEDLKYTEHESKIGHAMLENIVKEEGANNLINRFKKKNMYLAQYASYINEAYTIGIAEAKCKEKDCEEDNCTYSLDAEHGKKFVENIMTCTPDKVAGQIEDRVTSSIQSFIDDNIENKYAIKNIYAKTKQKVDKAKSEGAKQEFANMAKLEVSKNIYRKNCSLFEMMVRSVSESVMKHDELKQNFVNESGRLDLRGIVENTAVMYTVLEIVNSLGALNIDEPYIKNLIKELKK